MHRALFDRQLGGFKTFSKYSWASPVLVADLFLERFETSRFSDINLSQFSLNDALPIASQFGKSANTSYLCAVTDEEGLVQIFDTRRKFLETGKSRVAAWQAHSNAAFDFQWIDGDRKCLTASGDQTVTMWDVSKMTKLNRFKGHWCSVRSVTPRPGSWEQSASGARDGHIMMWDSRVNKRSEDGTNLPVKTINYAHSLSTRENLRRHRRNNRASGPKGVMDTQQSVTCVLYQHENLLISSGAMDGCVKFWDTRKWYSNSTTSLPIPVQTFDYPATSQRLKGVVTMCMDPWNSQLFVSYTDHRVYQFDIAGTQKSPVEYMYAGHRNDTFFVRCVVSPDGRYLLSGSGRNTGVIWEIDQPQKQPTFLIGHVNDVTSVDWCSNDLCKMVTLSDDMSLKIWQPSSRELGVEDPEIQGYAFTPAPGKKCTRKANIHILHDEFPWRHIESINPVQVTPERRIRTGSSLPERLRPTGRNIVFRSLNLAAQRSPGPHSAVSSASSSPVSLSPFHDAEEEKSPVLPVMVRPGETTPHKGGAGVMTPPKLKSTEATPSKGVLDIGHGFDCDCENVVQPSRFSPRRKPTSSLCPSTLNNTSPLATRHGDSPLALPFTSYALASSDSQHSVASHSEEEGQTGRVCLRDIHSNSPRKKEGCSFLTPTRGDNPGTSPSKSPGKNFVLSPRRSPRKRVPVSRFSFSSPTANLPNSVLDPPRKLESAQSPAARKVDWLTSYRLSKAESPASLESKASPIVASRKLTYNSPGTQTPSPGSGKKCRNHESGTPKQRTCSAARKESGNKRGSCTLKRKCSFTPKKDCLEITPSKRVRMEGTNEEETNADDVTQAAAPHSPNRTSSTALSEVSSGMSILHFFH